MFVTRKQNREWRLAKSSTETRRKQKSRSKAMHASKRGAPMQWALQRKRAAQHAIYVKIRREMLQSGVSQSEVTQKALMAAKKIIVEEEQKKLASEAENVRRLQDAEKRRRAMMERTRQAATKKWQERRHRQKAVEIDSLWSTGADGSSTFLLGPIPTSLLNPRKPDTNTNGTIESPLRKRLGIFTTDEPEDSIAGVDNDAVSLSGVSEIGTAAPSSSSICNSETDKTRKSAYNLGTSSDEDSYSDESDSDTISASQEEEEEEEDMSLSNKRRSAYDMSLPSEDDEYSDDVYSEDEYNDKATSNKVTTMTKREIKSAKDGQITSNEKSGEDDQNQLQEDRKIETEKVLNSNAQAAGARKKRISIPIPATLGRKLKLKEKSHIQEFETQHDEPQTSNTQEVGGDEWLCKCGFVNSMADLNCILCQAAQTRESIQDSQNDKETTELENDITLSTKHESIVEIVGKEELDRREDVGSGVGIESDDAINVRKAKEEFAMLGDKTLDKILKKSTSQKRINMFRKVLVKVGIEDVGNSHEVIVDSVLACDEKGEFTREAFSLWFADHRMQFRTYVELSNSPNAAGRGQISHPFSKPGTQGTG